jgi:hypothetical protein
MRPWLDRGTTVDHHITVTYGGPREVGPKHVREFWRRRRDGRWDCVAVTAYLVTTDQDGESRPWVRVHTAVHVCTDPTSPDPSPDHEELEDTDWVDPAAWLRTLNPDRDLTDRDHGTTQTDEESKA